MLKANVKRLTKLVLLTVLASLNVQAKPACYEVLVISADEYFLSAQELRKQKPELTPKSTALKTAQSTVWKKAIALARAEPKNVKMLEAVPVKYSENEGSRVRNYKGERNILVVSLEGVARARKRELTKKVLSVFGADAVSFPLSSGAGHLYTQFRGKVYDSMGSLTKSDYEAPGSDRLETMVVLSKKESDKLNIYISNIIADSSVIGSFSMDGGVRTRGKLNDNTCLSGGGHNCTSWLSMAPIGEDGKSLMQLIGIPAASQWGTNPGYLSLGLMTRSNVERTPFVVLWTQKNFRDFINEDFNENGELIWDFSPH